MSEPVTTVLVVDDDAVDRMAVRRTLSSEAAGAAFEVLEASNALEAAGILRAQPIDCLLLDLHLPGGSGLEVLRGLRSEGHDLPVVMLTGSSDAQTAVELMKAGASDFLTKRSGLSAERLAQSVLNAVRLGRAERERDRLHAAVRESEEQLRELAEAMPQIVFRADKDGVGDYWNERWYEFTGHARGDVSAASWDAAVHPDDREPAAARWREALRTGGEFKIEYRLRDSRTGTYRWFLGRALPVRDASGQVVRWFGSLTDVDAQKQVAQELERALVAEQSARAEAERAMHFSELFLGILGHDLRNPLSVISMGGNLLLRSTDSAPQRKTLGRMVASAERMARMIEQLLDFTRIRIGAGIAIRCVPADATALLRRVLEEFEIADPHAVMQLDVEGDTSGTWDEDRLLQIFSNLVGNALAHGKRGAKVSVRLDGSAADGVAFAVHNQGAIAPDLLTGLFEPFKSGARRPAGQRGLGLGLYISEQLVLGHGGRVEVTSTEAEGTRFRVWLPRRGLR